MNARSKFKKLEGFIAAPHMLFDKNGGFFARVSSSSSISADSPFSGLRDLFRIAHVPQEFDGVSGFGRALA